MQKIYALVLASDLEKKDWVCYLIADSASEIKRISCYSPTIIKLPKSQYHGVVDQTPVVINSCATGDSSEFRIVTISDLQLYGTFNLAYRV